MRLVETAAQRREKKVFFVSLSSFHFPFFADRAAKKQVLSLCEYQETEAVVFSTVVRVTEEGSRRIQTKEEEEKEGKGGSRHCAKTHQLLLDIWGPRV